MLTFRESSGLWPIQPGLESSLNVPCPKCEGADVITYKCASCNGSDVCMTCKGRKVVFSPDAAASVYVKGLRAAADGFAATREAKAGRLKRRETNLIKRLKRI